MQSHQYYKQTLSYYNTDLFFLCLMLLTLVYFAGNGEASTQCIDNNVNLLTFIDSFSKVQASIFPCKQ